MADLSLHEECPSLKIEPGFHQAFEVFCKELDIHVDTMVEITLCDDAMISKIHLEALDIQGPTDCIAFPLDFPEVSGAPPFLGAFYMGVLEVERNAKDLGHSFSDEAAFVLAHGILHLLGYEDYTPEEKASMFQKQEELVQLLEEKHPSWRPMFSWQGKT